MIPLESHRRQAKKSRNELQIDHTLWQIKPFRRKLSSIPVFIPQILLPPLLWEGHTSPQKGRDGSCIKEPRRITVKR